jgi:pimeloyl-ACP methyl ester carboxylesterase
VLRSFWTQPKFYEALAAHIESLPASARQVAEAGAVGEIPLVVVAAADAPPERMREHEAAARLSSRGRLIVARSRGHWLQLEEPETVARAILDVLEEARRG